MFKTSNWHTMVGTKSTKDKNLGKGQRLLRKEILEALVAEFPAGNCFTLAPSRAFAWGWDGARGTGSFALWERLVKPLINIICWGIQLTSGKRKALGSNPVYAFVSYQATAAPLPFFSVSFVVEFVEISYSLLIWIPWNCLPELIFQLALFPPRSQISSHYPSWRV
jgi:hypothetical protein